MEKEISISIDLGITLAAIAALLGIVLFTVLIGNNIKGGAGGQLADVKNEISVNYINALASGEIDNEMPTATAYNIFRTYEQIITETVNGYNGTVRNLMMQGSDLDQNLKGRVQLELKPLKDGTFVAFIHTGSNVNFDKGITDCRWYSGTCTCKLNTGVTTAFNSFKTKHAVSTGW